MKYIGNKSVDAELEVDFNDGIIKMDYTNSFYDGCMFDSNKTLILENRKLAGKPLRIVYKIFNIYLCFAIASLVLEVLKTIIEKMFNKQWIKYNLQYYYQFALKELVFIYRGFNEEVKRGDLGYKILSFNIPTNLYFEYELLGDYTHEIKSIKLERRFVKVLNPVTEIIKQSGWVVIFEFNNPPKHGECKITYST